MGCGHSTGVLPPEVMYTATAVGAVAAAAATALTLSPTSGVRGARFDRFVQIFLENQDYTIASGDPNLAYLKTLGISLDNYYAITHPSQPNYIVAAGGDTFNEQTQLDNFVRIPKDKKTIVDLLDAKKISWSVYQEGMPYSGFEGDYVNQQNGKNNYVRKHNPLMHYDSVTSDVNRLAKSKNFTMFYNDLEANALPQWMFITPNMTNDGHDSSVTVAGDWARNFLTPLLANKNFNTDRTLIILTFDESEHYSAPNHVYSVLLGGVIPSSRKGTSNSTQFNHYSLTKTVEDNWDLGNLGTNDASAIPFF